MPARILEADAEKQALIEEAEGKAKAIELINNANPTAAYVTMQGFDALKVLANGNSTKIIVPSELQNVTGLLTTMAETIKEPTKK